MEGNKENKDRMLGIQDMMNGPGFNIDGFFNFKLKHDLHSLLNPKDLLHFYFSLLNFSLDIKHLEDWYWHFFIKYNYKNKSQKDFQKWIINNSKEVTCFNDIANTFKHGDRYFPNNLVEQVLMRIVFGKDNDLSKINYDLKEKGFFFGEDQNRCFFVPMIKIESKEFYCLDVAKSAFDWWNKFKVENVNLE